MADFNRAEGPVLPEELPEHGDVEVLKLPPAISCMPKLNLSDHNFAPPNIHEESIGLAPPSGAFTILEANPGSWDESPGKGCCQHGKGIPFIAQPSLATGMATPPARPLGRLLLQPGIPHRIRRAEVLRGRA